MDKPSGQSDRPTSAEQGAATRKAILDAAAALIAEVGWGQVTTRAIAARAGVPHGAVGYHFNGKADLLREAAIAAVNEALAEPTELVRQAGSVRELLDATFWWYANGGLTDPSVALLLECSLEALRDEPLRRFIATEQQAYRDALAGLVRADQARGALTSAASAPGTATVVSALLDGLLLHAAHDPDLDIDGAAAALHALLEGR